MVCVRDNGEFTFPLSELEGPPLALRSILEPEVDDSYTISDRLWSGHVERTSRNLSRGTGFTANLANLNAPSNTLVARYGKDGKECLVPQEGRNPRMLTPRECARLQGFPEAYRIASAKTSAYRQFGNSVAVPVVKILSRAILDQVLSRAGE
jgi:DNA (cytosine-5)-methyltransferase 1